MCTKIFVCHGDKAKILKNGYKKSVTQPAIDDCKPALYYITNDGKYAIDADYISANQLAVGDVDLESVPKIKLSPK